MATTRDSYALSRWNATKWGTHVDGPLPCRGIESCRYRYCEDEPACVPSPGSPCSFEQAYSQAHEEGFRRQWGYVATATCVDFEELVAESTTIALQRVRIATRSNRAWTLTDGNGGLADKAYKELELCERYHTTMSNRWSILLGKLQQASTEMTERWDRLYKAAYGIERPPGRAVHLFA